MPTFRVMCSHYVREFIYLDVMAESVEEISEQHSDVYAAACELLDWEIDYEAAPEDETVRIVDGAGRPADIHVTRNPELAEKYDTEAAGTAEIRDDGTVHVLSVRVRPDIREIMSRVLESNASRCLDNAEERKAVVDGIFAALKEEKIDG